MPPVGILALGLVQGALAAIDALGIVLLYRTTRIVNLAQPSMGLIGGTLTGLLVTTAGWSFWWAAPVGIATGAVIGLATDRIVLRRLADAPRAVVLVATVGLAQIFGAVSVALAFAIHGRPVPTYPISLGVTIDLSDVTLLGPHILVLIALPIAWYGTHRFLNKSRFGLAALALGQEQERARALGVSASAVRAVVWAVAGVLASIGGILSIPVLGFNLGGGLGPLVLLMALTGAVLAGLRSLHVAVVTALAVGVAYAVAFHYATSASATDYVVAGAVVLAVALRRRRLGREEAASRASSWEAAATPRPLPRSLASAAGVRVGAGALLVGALVGVAIPPLFLPPSGDVGYVITVASTAIAALGVAVAWMFSGEVSLGHWGFAGVGAVVAVHTPGPWPVRALVATVAVAAAGALLGLTTLRRSTLSFALVSLAIAAAAPALARPSIGRPLLASPGTVASVAGVLGVLAAGAVLWLRRTRTGARMVAARDDPQRAPWLGADLARTRVLALAISTALAGLAGSLYLAGSTIGITENSFAAVRSLDVLSLAVIGGLGSPAGALLGAGGIAAARIVLPPTWAALVSGAGLLIVVIFMPAGLSRIFGALRDGAVKLVAPRSSGGRPEPDRAAA